jgi:hypothetical protein
MTCGRTSRESGPCERACLELCLDERPTDARGIDFAIYAEAHALAWTRDDVVPDLEETHADEVARSHRRR